MYEERHEERNRNVSVVMFEYKKVTLASIHFALFELPYSRTVKGQMQALKVLLAANKKLYIRNTDEYTCAKFMI